MNVLGTDKIMSETFIFDVPIYRTAKASYNEDQKSYVDVKRVVRKPRHKILICKNAGLGFGIPVDIHPQSSNGEIFSHIMKYLDSVRSYPEFRNRFIDSALLETIGPYVDWKSLINSKL